MDVMKPDVLWIKGRCYRLYDQKDRASEKPNLPYMEDEEKFYDNAQCQDEGSEDEYELVTSDSGKLKMAFHVPRSIHAILIGTKGSAKQRLERETKTVISVPKKGVDGDIFITGDKRKNVVSARRRIDRIVLAARQRQEFTHFLSIPVTNSSVQEGFEKFKKRVTEECCGRGVSADVFQDPAKLHLTLGTMVLLDDVDRKMASNALFQCKREVIEPLLKNRQLRVEIKGIDFMNDDPAEVDVLYGCLNDLTHPPVLQELADSIVSYLAKTGLMPKQHSSVKLHVTLMNSLFRENEGDSEDTHKDGVVKRKRSSFDASEILKQFRDFKFGDIVVSNVDLSRRYSTAKNGYYEATACINI